MTAVTGRLCNAPAPRGAHPAGLACLRLTGHPGPHAAELIWTGDAPDSWAVIEPAAGNPARDDGEGWWRST